MSRYRLEKLGVGGPPHGFVIHAPDGHPIYDINPQSIVRELNRLQDNLDTLEHQITVLLGRCQPIQSGDLIEDKWWEAKP